MVSSIKQGLASISKRFTFASYPREVHVQTTMSPVSVPEPSSNQPFFVILPYEIRRMVYAYIISDFEMHLCFGSSNHHNDTDPTCKHYSCLQNSFNDATGRPYPTEPKIRMHMIPYMRQGNHTCKLPQHSLIWPALVCRQMSVDWLPCMRRANFSFISVDVLSLPLLLNGHSPWLKRQFANCEHLQLIVGDNYKDLGRTWKFTKQYRMLSHLHMQSNVLFFESFDYISTLCRNLRRLTIAIHDREIEFEGQSHTVTFSDNPQPTLAYDKFCWNQDGLFFRVIQGDTISGWGVAGDLRQLTQHMITKHRDLRTTREEKTWIEQFQRWWMAREWWRETQSGLPNRRSIVFSPVVNHHPSASTSTTSP